MAFAPLTSKGHVVLVDGSGFIHRAYHALPSIVRRADHHPVGALFGYASMLWHLQLAFQQGNDAPTHIVVVFDAGGPNHRHALYPQYKANRPRLPDELLRQLGPIRQATDALGIARVELPGQEADDIIATYATRAKKMKARVTIVSQDKDLRQLIDATTTLYDPMKRATIDADRVKAIMGVWPTFVGDLLALMGDIADNVPGVPGIGAKGAALLVNQHGGIDAILQAAHAGTVDKHRDTLILNEAPLRLSRQLVELNAGVPSLPSLAAFARRADVAGFTKYLREYDLHNLADRIGR